MKFHLSAIFLFLGVLQPFAALFSTNFIESHKWKTNTIYYGFQLPLEYTVDQIDNFKGAVYLAIEEFNDSVENLFTFEEFNVTSPIFKKYIIFSDMQGDSGECSKTYASKKGLIRVSFNSLSGCQNSHLVHDILRALGFQNEDVRGDRDEYIHLNFSNIYPGSEHYFDICESCMKSSLDIFVVYDQCSILHKSKNAYRKKLGVEVITIYDEIIGCVHGQRQYMTTYDVRKVEAVYG
jgi:hypothetical protein